MTPGFSRLQVSGYRRLRDLDLYLRPLNVLIGANSVGKTTLLDTLRLLAMSADGRLINSLIEAGGYSSVITADGRSHSISFSLEQRESDDAILVYVLNLGTSGFGYAITSEHLVSMAPGTSQPSSRHLEATFPLIQYNHEDKWSRPNWDYKPQETALSQVPKTFQNIESFRHALSDVSEMYHSLDVSPRAPVRTPQTISPAQTPGTDGEDLVSCLYTIRETANDRFEAIEDAPRAVFPTFDRLDFPPVAAGRITLAWQEKGFARPFYASELSEGTLRFLWLATLLQSPGLPKVTLIDEPEVSLHPEMLRLLTDLMREASDRTQLIVATHSDRFVRFLEPAELLVCDQDDDGGMTVKRADTLDLNEWMQDYTLDQLWSMGRLGGRS